MARKDVAVADGGIIVPGEPKPQPPAQAGLLTAGDYDDVLNPDLYKAYLDKVLQGELAGKDLPYVDANQRIDIRVIDRLGKPVPLASIMLKSADGKALLPLRTGANGMAYLYPLFDTLEAGMTVSVTAKGQDNLSATVPASLIEEGGELVFEMDNDRKPVKALDLLLTIDATGSMSDEMTYIQKELEGILDRVKAANEGLDIRVGLIVYRDQGDQYVIRDFPFTDDFNVLKADLNAQSAGGGGDMPEAMQDAMAKGLEFDWREDAVKVTLLVADAPPHDGDILETWFSATASRSQGIHVVSLAASGVDKTAEFLMRAMGQITGGRYLFLTDDSGIGNPHAEPTVDCYVVTRLDGLVTRVLSGLVSGERIEPEGDDVIRTVGNYRAGMCKVGELSGE
ncbi:MAG: VWA domain-containing protein [Hyphomonas sp.]